LCGAAGPDRCALAGHGPVAPRVNRLRHHPLPAPSADPPGELTYGEALTTLKLAALAEPNVWPLAAAALEAAIQGDASVIETIARTFTSDQVRIGIQDQSTALICADSPARQPAKAWPRVVDQLEAVSRIGGPVVGWLAGAPCASWPSPSADRYTGLGTPPPSIQSWSSVPGSTPPRRFVTPGWRRGGRATRVLLVHDGSGHLTRRDPSSCVTQAISHYLVELATPPSGTVCPSDRPPSTPTSASPSLNRRAGLPVPRRATLALLQGSRTRLS
jgi:hypothetical protein